MMNVTKNLLLFISLCFFFEAHATKVPPLFIGTAPVKLTVSYGARNKEVLLQYGLVSNLPSQSQKLSRFHFKGYPESRNIRVKRISTTCPKNKLPPRKNGKGVCTIKVKLLVSGVQPPSHNALAATKYRLSFTFGDGRKTTLSSRYLAIEFARGIRVNSQSRQFHFTNYCNYPVWFGIAAGATESIREAVAGDKQSCSDRVNSSDCYPGSRCIKVKNGLNHCFWLNPAPANNNFKLAKYNGTKADSNTVTFPVYDNGIDAVWSGGIAGRTTCNAAACDTGDCKPSTNPNGHDKGCPIGQGFTAPVSTAEFTLLASKSLILTTNTDGDTYDVTVINGVTTPLSMTPKNVTWGGRQKPYQCGVPGAASTTQSSAACNWNQFTVPRDEYVFVKYNAAAASCAINPCMVSGEVCGSSFNPVGSIVTPEVCGIPLGYWTADAICAKDKNFSNVGMNIDCNGALSAPDASYTEAELYGCSKGIFANSCYSAGAVKGACCGCVDWHTVAGINVPAPPITQSCNKISTANWLNLSKPKLKWLKRACPNAYVYPYDDASSTFTCQQLNADNINKIDYDIQFCPTV